MESSFQARCQATQSTASSCAGSRLIETTVKEVAVLNRRAVLVHAPEVCVPRDLRVTSWSLGAGQHSNLRGSRWLAAPMLAAHHRRRLNWAEPVSPSAEMSATTAACRSAESQPARECEASSVSRAMERTRVLHVEPIG